jgi:hypothetical protein
MLERKQNEIRKIEEYLTSKNATERQRKKWQTEFDSLAEDIAEMKQVVHEAETGKPITAKNEITKKMRVKKKPAPEPINDDFLLSAAAEMKERSK